MSRALSSITYLQSKTPTRLGKHGLLCLAMPRLRLCTSGTDGSQDTAAEQSVISVNALHVYKCCSIPPGMVKITGVGNDWDGVWADTAATLLDAYDRQAAYLIQEGVLEKKPWKDQISFMAWFTPDYGTNLDRLGAKQHHHPHLLDLFIETFLEPSSLFPGMMAVAEELHRYQAFILSSNSERVISQLLEQNGLSGLFGYIGGHETKPPKPHPGSLERSLCAMGLTPEETLYVDDTAVGIQFARKGKLGLVAAARWGWEKEGLLEQRLEERHVQPDLYLDAPEEYAVLLQELRHNPKQIFT